MTKIGKRYSLGEKIESKFTHFSSEEIEEYNGFDNLHKQPILIKIFRLPAKPEAKKIAITLWEREIRLTRKAMGSRGGNILLQLIDAFIDKESNKLYIITSKHGNSLEEWLFNEDSLWFLMDLNENTRKEIWKMFQSLLSGIGALHTSKLLHRNINPGTIYYSEEKEKNILKLGGISWSLYLHNLNFIPERFMQKKRSYSLFQAPESLNDNIQVSSYANPFSKDIFSLGMILCFIFYQDFPEYPPKNYNEWQDLYSKILNFFSRSNSNLNKSEIDLIIRCISQNPKDRPKTIQEFRREIQTILNTFEEYSKDIEFRLKVNWYNLPESYFLKDLARIVAIPIDEIITDPNKWLQEDFKNATIYTTAIKKFSLVILNNKDDLFYLVPIHDKLKNTYNKDILYLKVVPPRQRRYISSIINNKNPIAILKNGLQFTSERFSREPLSHWRKLWDIAENECKEKQKDLTEEERFVDSLRIMLEAENRLDSKNMLQFRRENIKRNPLEKIERGLIEVALDFNREMKGSERNQIIDILTNFKNKNGGIVELTVSSSPSSSWNHRCEWKIIKIHRKDLKCTIERSIKRKNKVLEEEGTIRPFEMNLSLSLYRRKEFIIDRIKENDLLLSAILNPRYKTFYLGLDHQIENETVRNILNTIPMFLIQGPPGTGKTWVASTIVAKILQNNPYSRILISSKDHHPLDHLVEAVIEKIPKNLDPKPVIIRAMSSERESEYEATDTILNYTNVMQTKKILEAASQSIQNLKNFSKKLEDKWNIMINENKVNPSLRWMDEVKKVANVVFATSTSSTIEWLGKNAPPYDWIIVEEAAKSYPVELLLPMNLGHRWLLIGDQNQLPPYMYNDMAIEVSDIIDEEQTKSEKDETVYIEFRDECLRNIKLFEKLFNNFTDVKVLFSENRYNPCSQLKNQWRLPPLISDMISEIFYKIEFNTMKIAPKNGDPFEEPEFLTNNQLIWIDTPHAMKNNLFKEKRGPEGSYYNLGEIELIIKLTNRIKINKNFSSQDKLDIIFLTPYAAQKEEIIRAFHNKPNMNFKPQKLARCCHTVDSYQGKQADIVIISLVRNNDNKNLKSALGFLTAEERLNVMFSRVRKRMVIIGCSEQLLNFKNNIETNAIINIFEFIREKGLVINPNQLEGII